VYTHTNLKLEQLLEMYETGLFPWDIEMTVEESVSDDDDGPPHRVFIFLHFCIASSHSWKTNMLFPEYHNRFRYIAHVSLRKWVFINPQEFLLLSTSVKKNLKKNCTCTARAVVK
jgi:hypothetical protein